MESMSPQSSLTLSPAASVTTPVDLESDHSKQRIKKKNRVKRRINTEQRSSLKRQHRQLHTYDLKKSAKIMSAPIGCPACLNSFGHVFDTLKKAKEHFSDENNRLDFMVGEGPLYNPLVCALIQLESAFKPGEEADSKTRGEIVAHLDFYLKNSPIPWRKFPCVYNPDNTVGLAQEIDDPEQEVSVEEDESYQIAIQRLDQQNKAYNMESFVPEWMLRTSVVGLLSSDLYLNYYNLRNTHATKAAGVWTQDDFYKVEDGLFYDCLVRLKDKDRTLQEGKITETEYLALRHLLTQTDDNVNKLKWLSGSQRFCWDTLPEVPGMDERIARRIELSVTDRSSPKHAPSESSSHTASKPESAPSAKKSVQKRPRDTGTSDDEMPVPKKIRAEDKEQQLRHSNIEIDSSDLNTLGINIDFEEPCDVYILTIPRLIFEIKGSLQAIIDNNAEDGFKDELECIDKLLEQLYSAIDEYMTGGLNDSKDLPVVSEELVATNRDITMLQKAVDLVRHNKSPASDFDELQMDDEDSLIPFTEHWDVSKLDTSAIDHYFDKPAESVEVNFNGMPDITESGISAESVDYTSGKCSFSFENSVKLVCKHLPKMQRLYSDAKGVWTPDVAKREFDVMLQLLAYCARYSQYSLPFRSDRKESQLSDQDKEKHDILIAGRKLGTLYDAVQDFRKAIGTAEASDKGADLKREMKDIQDTFNQYKPKKIRAVKA